MQPDLLAEPEPSPPGSRFAAERKRVAKFFVATLVVLIPALHQWSARAERLEECRKKAEAHAEAQQACGEAIRLIDALAEHLPTDTADPALLAEAKAELAAARRKESKLAEYHAAMRSKWKNALAVAWWKPIPADPPEPQ